ncbi:MAG: hypothetical protein E7588_04780 [Ruminococcaceae bacterium]|nr:hypothetical protein [Oscillospiraceae bacterium]
MAEKTLVETLKDNRIRTGAMLATLHYDEAHVKALAEAGIDILTINVDHIPTDKREEFLDLLAKYGIEAIAHADSTDKHFMGAHMFDKEKNDNLWFKDKPAFTTYMFVDEPGTVHYDELRKSVDDFRALHPGKRPYINLLPMYANARQLAGGAWMAPIEYFDTAAATYQEYVDQYVEKLDTDYICVDIYPCMREPHPKYPEMFPAEYTPTYYKDYVKNIEIVANACRDSGRDFWVYIQTCSWGSWVREPNEAEIRWQAYTMLSFGAKTILYYIFATCTSHTGCAFDVRGDKTKIYFAIQRMAQGLHKLSDLYVSYKYVGAFNVNSTPEATPYLEMYNPYKEFKAITDLTCDTPLLVGCFEKKEGKGNAFTLVNQQDWKEPKGSVITFKAQGKVTLYYDGEPQELTPVNGVYTVKLEQGDGVFVTVD